MKEKGKRYFVQMADDTAESGRTAKRSQKRIFLIEKEGVFVKNKGFLFERDESFPIFAAKIRGE